MYKILALEWIKNKSNLSFWIFLVVYGATVYIVCSSGAVLLNATLEMTSNGDVQAPPELNMYEFPNIWHNISYIATFMRIILALIVIINITNEINQRTLRQNIIDGLSPFNFLASKFSLVFILTCISTLLVLGLGLYFGNQYSSLWNYDVITSKMDFIVGYFFEILTYLCFALLMSFLLKKPGMAIVIMVVYSLFIGPLLGWWVLDKEGIMINLLPVNSLNNILLSPANAFINPEAVQTQVDPFSLGIAGAWIATFLGLSYLLLTKRDW